MQRTRGGGERVNAVCFVDGAKVTDEAALPLDARGVLLGDSVFETMRSYGGRIFELDAHLERLERSARWARLRLGATRQAVGGECEAAARAIAGDAAVRVLIVRGARSEGPLASQPTRRIVVAEPLVLDRAIYAEGVSACLLPAADFGTAESAHAKYARYLPRLLARDEALGRGFGEALLTDASGRIVEAATGSVVAVTPEGLVAASILDGITKRVVLALGREASLVCAERAIDSADREAATEMFVASSLRELVPIVRIEEAVVGSGAPGPVTRALHAALRARAGAT